MAMIMNDEYYIDLIYHYRNDWQRIFNEFRKANGANREISFIPFVKSTVGDDATVKWMPTLYLTRITFKTESDMLAFTLKWK